MVISEICYNFIVLMYKALQTQIAMITEDKVTEIFCITDDFCNFFDTIMVKYTLKTITKRKDHRYSTKSKAEIMRMIFYHRVGRTTYCVLRPPMKREFTSRLPCGRPRYTRPREPWRRDSRSLRGETYRLPVGCRPCWLLPWRCPRRPSCLRIYSRHGSRPYIPCRCHSRGHNLLFL